MDARLKNALHICEERNFLDSGKEVIYFEEQFLFYSQLINDKLVHFFSFVLHHTESAEVAFFLELYYSSTHICLIYIGNSI